MSLEFRTPNQWWKKGKRNCLVLCCCCLFYAPVCIILSAAKADVHTRTRTQTRLKQKRKIINRMQPSKCGCVELCVDVILLDSFRFVYFIWSFTFFLSSLCDFSSFVTTIYLPVFRRSLLTIHSRIQ